MDKTKEKALVLRSVLPVDEIYFRKIWHLDQRACLAAGAGVGVGQGMGGDQKNEKQEKREAMETKGLFQHT